ncbi:MAG: Trm112 family protein [Chthoniobacterales bacterium]
MCAAAVEIPTRDTPWEQLLCCPITRQPLALASAEQLHAVNQKIAAGEARNLSGVLLTEPIETALVREDLTVVYPVRSHIPLLIPEEGISIVHE